MAIRLPLTRQGHVAILPPTDAICRAMRGRCTRSGILNAACSNLEHAWAGIRAPKEDVLAHTALVAEVIRNIGRGRFLLQGLWALSWIRVRDGHNRIRRTEPRLSWSREPQLFSKLVDVSARVRRRARRR